MSKDTFKLVGHAHKQEAGTPNLSCLLLIQIAGPGFASLVQTYLSITPSSQFQEPVTLLVHGQSFLLCFPFLPLILSPADFESCPWHRTHCPGYWQLSSVVMDSFLLPGIVFSDRNFWGKTNKNVWWFCILFVIWMSDFSKHLLVNECIRWKYLP